MVIAAYMCLCLQFSEYLGNSYLILPLRGIHVKLYLIHWHIFVFNFVLERFQYFFLLCASVMLLFKLANDDGGGFSLPEHSSLLVNGVK